MEIMLVWRNFSSFFGSLPFTSLEVHFRASAVSLNFWKASRETLWSVRREIGD